VALDAVVLAGGPPDAVAALEPGAPNKAFVTIGGVALVTRTIAGLSASSRIDRIVAVAPPSAAADPALAGASEVRGDGPRMLDSLRAGLEGFTEDALVVVAAADLPALDAAAVDEFVDAALARDLDIAYACVERRYHEAAFAGFPHTWARMRDGRFCGGGVAALRPRVLPALGSVLDALGTARKSPLRLAGIFGWDMLLRFALGRASIADAETRASALLGGVRAGAIRCTQAQIALNVDRVADVALARARFGTAGPGLMNEA
jgi:molybdopterin-guanine dinucleotide biosynthesis protein A